MEALKIVIIIFEVVLLFNLVILVHELGHFLAARWRGLKVERFGIWFGKPIWERKINGVIYSLGSIPAGGFVALPQMAPMEVIEGKNDSTVENLPPIKPIDKIIVAFAGPLFSFLLAFVFAAIVYLVGRPVGETETTTTIGFVEKGSPAEKVGIKPGDKVLEVDGQAVKKFAGVGQTVSWLVVRSEGDTIKVRVDRQGKTLTFHPTPTKPATKSWERKGLREIGIEPKLTPMIAAVRSGYPAANVGLKANDVILEVNGKPVYHVGEVGEAVIAGGLQPVSFKVQRGKQMIDTTLTPVKGSADPVPRIGVEWNLSGKMGIEHPGPVEQVSLGVNTMISTFGALFSPKSDIGPQHLSGPVGIMRIYYLLFKSEQGWRLALWFSVVLNINLAILNLLPIPVLDGGHITLAVIEGVRRKPIQPKILQWIQTSCAMLVIGYILYVSFYDVQDLKGRRKTEANPAPKEAVQPRGTNP